jgi:hypothetical protein
VNWYRPLGFVLICAVLPPLLSCRVEGGTPPEGEAAAPSPEIVPLAVEDYPWLHGEAKDLEPLQSRLDPPPGYARIPAKEDGFGEWLRGLPTRPGRPPVRLYDGREKSNQRAHHLVLDVDVGEKDLQQCADAVIRLRAEYLWARRCDKAVAFRFTSGDLAEWAKWREGFRPRVSGNRVSWSPAAAPDGSRESFRRYLDTVFTYAGSASLEGELDKVADPSRPEIGDVYIQGGFPGHAVLVVDAAENGKGERVTLLAQSYMPAQEIHLLRNPGSGTSPWFRAMNRGALETPEWSFRHEDLRRFPETPCTEPPDGVSP